MKTLELEVQRIRDWRHEVPNKFIAPVQAQIQEVHDAVDDLKATIASSVDGIGERRLLRMRDVYVFAAGAGAITALGKILGWF